MSVALAIGACLVTTASAQAPQQKQLQSDQEVKNPLGVDLEGGLPNQQVCIAMEPVAYAQAVAQANRWCVKNYQCPKQWPLYYRPFKGLEACTCSVAPPGVPDAGTWRAFCDLSWNGACGCESPAENPDPTTLDVALTPEEVAMLADLYPLLSADLSAQMKPKSAADRSAALAAAATKIQTYLDGKAFKTAVSSRQGGLALVITLAAPLSQRVPGSVATITIAGDGAARIAPSSNLPGGVARGLATAIGLALSGSTPLPK